MSEKGKNPFKELEKSPKEVPEHLREKVMSDIAAAQLVADMASLFTCNYKSTIKGAFKTNPKLDF